MTVERLIRLALANINVQNPEPEQFQSALDHLNLIVSNFSWWNEGDQPIYGFDNIYQEVNLPPYYLEIFELLLSAREGIAYGTPLDALMTLESKAKQLTDRLVYRRQTTSTMQPTTFVV